MHSAFSYDRRDPYTRLPIDAQPDPITHINNLSEHVSHFIMMNTLNACLGFLWTLLSKQQNEAFQFTCKTDLIPYKMETYNANLTD
jgi:hypothetical protein